MSLSSSASDVDLIDEVRKSTINKLSKRDEINNKKLSEEQRRKFFLEPIHIFVKYGQGSKQIEEEDEGVAKDSTRQGGSQKLKEWHIQRIRLNPDFLQQLVDRLLHSTEESGAIIAYLKEVETGQIILPHDMQRICRAFVASALREKRPNTRSCSYELYLSKPNKIKDVLDDTNDIAAYQGQMKFVLHNVPLQSQNSLHEVKATHIQNWIVDGILHEDQDVRKTENRIKSIMKSLESKRRQMERVSDEPVFNDRGQELTGKKAQTKREEKYNLLQQEKDTLHVQYDEALDNLKETKMNVLKKIEMTVIQHDEKETWEFAFQGEHRESLDDLVVKKRNWNTCFMYTDPTVDLLGGDFVSSADKEYLVDSAGISIERLENGFGCFHKRMDDVEDFKNSTLSHVYAYHGTFCNGKKSGNGILVSLDGVFAGKMNEDMPCDKGVFISKDGDVIHSDFSPPTHPTPRVGVNPYTKSVPHGHCRVQFSDGAYYEGQMKYGMIHGKGTYISSNGEIQEGEFFEGSLIQGKKVTSSGDILAGNFHDGLLFGEGSYQSKVNRSRQKGYFVDGSIHGIGEEKIEAKDNSLLSKYQGMFCNGRRSGFGSLNFRDVGFMNDCKTLEKDDLCLRGFWIAGQPKSGGMITKKAPYFASPTTHHPSSRFRWLSRLRNVEEKKIANQNKTYELQRSRTYKFHSKIESQKRNIYDQHELYIRASLRGDKGVVRQFQQSRVNRWKSLPSHSKYYKNRKINRAPSTIQEALQTETPGLRMVERGGNDADEMGLLRRTLDRVKETWRKDPTLLYFESEEMSMIHGEFDELEEEWSIIDVDRLRRSIAEE